MRKIKFIAYLSLVAVILTLLFSIPIGYDYLNQQNKDEIITYVNLSLDSDNPTEKLDELLTKYKFDITVESKEYYYSTTDIDIDEFSQLSDNTGLYVESNHINGYNYVISIPPLTFDEFYSYIVIIELLVAFLILFWVIITIRKITNTLIQPLETLKINISRLKDFEFNTLDKRQQDLINQELLLFSDELTNVINTYNKDISQTRLDIEKNNAVIELQRQYLLTSIHDIKNEVRNVKYSTSDETVIALIDNLIYNCDDILQTYIDDNEYDFSQKSKITVDECLFKIVKNFKNILDENDISVSIKLKDLYLYDNEALVTQLFTNIISNNVKHCDYLGEIDIYGDGDYLVFTNTHEDYIDIDKIFEFNYTTTKESKLGFGMARILQISKTLDYDLNIEQRDDKFILKLKMRYYDK